MSELDVTARNDRGGQLGQPRSIAALSGDRAARGSPDRFGYSWNIYSEILPEHHEQFLRWTSALRPDLWRNATFLDAGCGIGRNAYWAMREGASSGVAIDIEERTLEAAHKNLADDPGVDVRRQSIYEITETDCFDIVFSIGVIHHLSEPHSAMRRLVRAAKPGGRVLIWVYGAENMGWLMRFFDPIRASVLSRLPLPVVHWLSLMLTAVLWLVLRLGLSKIEYYRLLRTFRFSHLRAIVFDQMIPRIAHYWPRQTVDTIMTQAGLEDVELVHVNGMSWSASGRKRH